MIQKIRSLEERIKTNTYNIPELRMLVEQIGWIEVQTIEPRLRNVLHSLTIVQADILVNGAAN